MKIQQRFIHEAVTKVGAVAGVSGVLFQILVTINDPSAPMATLVWAVVFAAVPVTQVVVRRPNASLVAAAGLVAMAGAALTGPDAASPTMRLWTIGVAFTVGIVIPLIGDHERAKAAFFAVIIPAMLLVTHPHDSAWIETIGIATTFAGTYLTVVYIVLRIVLDARNSEARHRLAFHNSPIATWEQDYTRVVAHLADLRRDGVVDIRAYFEADIERLHHCMSMFDQGTLSQTTLDVFDADSIAEFIEPSALDVLGPDVAGAILDQLTAIWDGGTTTVNVVKSATLKGNPLWLRLHWAAPVVDGEPDYANVVLAAIDLTAQKNAEAELEAEIQAKDDFLAAVSHELRTPLAAVVGISRELADNRDTISHRETTELIRMVADESWDVANIVEDLLAAARLEAGQLTINREMVDLLDLASQVAQRLPIAKEVEGSLKGYADPNRVRQIIRNLLTNAQRYGGPNVRIVGRAIENRVALEVRDDGPGIASHLHETVFEAYQRAEARPGLTGSVGIGLSVSRNLARLMGGDLSYNFEQSESVFTLELPASESTPDAVDPLAS